jgi:hypothetical protein
LSSQDIRIFISDCSGDATKRERVVHLQNTYPFCNVSIRDQRTAFYQDVVALLETTSSYPYVAICADDDYVSLDYLVRSVDVLDQDRAAVCSAGNYLVWLRDGIIRLGSRNSTETSPVTRLQKSFDPERFNTMLFAVFRRSAMAPWLNFYKGHPMIGPFFDFVHYWSLLAQGTVRCHRKGFYLWTGENWDTPDKADRSRARYYNDVGLPDAFAWFHDLHFAVEGLHFFLGEHSPLLDRGVRAACAQTISSRCMARFRRDVDLNREKYLDLLRDSPQSVQAFQSLVQQQDISPTMLIDLFVTVVAAFSKQQSERYAAHIRASLSRAGMYDPYA